MSGIIGACNCNSDSVVLGQLALLDQSGSSGRQLLHPDLCAVGSRTLIFFLLSFRS